MKKLKADFLASIKNKKINVFILFLLFAFVILLFTKLSKEYTNTMAFQIEKLNVPQENVIFNDSVNLDITLKTHGFNWLKYYISKPKIKIDFSKDVSKKEAVFVWNKSIPYLNNTQFNKQVELLSISPDPITFRFGVNMVKKVPVILNTEINFSPGFDMSGHLTADPDSITVIGSDVLVSKIIELKAEPIILNDIKANVLEIVKLKLPKNTSDLKFSSKQITLKGQVERFTEGTLKVPVSIINVPKNTKVKYFPKVVNVLYYVSLSDFNAITEKDFKVVCDFNKTNESQSFLIPEITKSPKAVKNVKIGQQRVEFIITK